MKKISNSLIVKTLLLCLQVIFSILALYTLLRVGNLVLFLTNLPTMSCPDGENIYMTSDLMTICEQERIANYLPQWIAIGSRVFVPSYLFFTLLGIGFNRLGEPDPEANGTEFNFVRFHIGVLIVVLLLHWLIYPNGWGRLLMHIWHGYLPPITK